MSSYSPSIYFSKVNFLLKHGITFKELVVYIDISDIQDEAISYELLDGVVVPKGVAAPKREVAPKITEASKDELVLIGEVPPKETLVTKGVEVSNNSNFKKWARSSFPLTYHGLHILKILYLPLDTD